MKYLFCSLQGGKKAVCQNQLWMKSKVKRAAQSHASEKIRSSKRRADQEAPVYDGWQKSWWGIGRRLGNLDPLWRQEKRNWKAPHGQAAGVGFGFTSTIPALVNTILT